MQLLKRRNLALLVPVLTILAMGFLVSCSNKDDGGSSTVAVTGVSISPNSNNASNPIVAAQGTSTYLTAVIAPSNATNQEVTWEVVDPSSASSITVDANGKVSVASTVSIGTTAKITVTTQDGSKTAIAYIKVVKVSPEAMVAVPTNGSTPITFPMNDNDDNNGMDDTTGTINHKFEIAQTEVTYELWKKVYDWANKDAGTCVPATGQYCYTFANKGSKGGTLSAGLYVENSGGTVKQPVTKVSWRVAIVWSNAYTEWYNAVKGGSLTVVYYTDAAYTTPLRTSTYDIAPNPLSSATAGSEDKPYIKANSNDNTDMASNTATGFRLPTSKEWEYAARLRTDKVNYVTAGSYGSGVSIGSTTYYFTKGNSASGANKPIGKYGMTLSSGETWETLRNEATRVAVYQKWYNGTYEASQSPATSSTANVATKAPNALGLYDMSGNVGEWCFDIHDSYPSYRVDRGGGWLHELWPVGFVTATEPNRSTQGNLGFRPVRSILP